MTATIYERDSTERLFTHPRAWCVVDLDAVQHNAQLLSQQASVPLVAMVKADAYGLGAEAIARALGAPFADQAVHAQRSSTGGGLWGLGVATVAEAVALRDVGCDARILCCSPLLREELSAAWHARIIPSLHRAEDIADWTSRGNAPWHLAIDTGMSRAGVKWSDAALLTDVIANHPPQGMYTHFHSAQLDNGSRELQTQRFVYALAALTLPADTLLHAANSYAIAAPITEPIENPAWHLARPGLSLYGVPAHSALGLRTVLHVYARIVDIHHVDAGDSVSYDATWTAQRPSRVATVSVGYGDGYRRALSNVGEMLVRGLRARVVGLVTMDLTMLDVTDVSCEIGDIVTVLGHPHPHLHLSNAGRESATAGNATTASATSASTTTASAKTASATSASTTTTSTTTTRTTAESTGTLSVSEVAEQGGLSPYELLVGWRLRLPRVYRQHI